VNRAIWRLFREQGITIPVAQREIVVTTRDGSAIARDV
jgi:small-conductance mechanosensitive channel